MDAIRIALDHRDDYAVCVFFSYHLLAEGGVKIDPPFALKGVSYAFQDVGL